MSANTIRRLLLPALLAGPAMAAMPAGASEGPPRASATSSAASRHRDDGAEADKAEREGRASSRKPALHGTVNLNTADEATLELLPFVGEKKATRILAFRHAHPFKRIEELTKVRGFGRKTFARLKPYLAVAGASTLGAEEAGAN